jgi:hypothetical protein
VYGKINEQLNNEQQKIMIFYLINAIQGGNSSLIVRMHAPSFINFSRGQFLKKKKLTGSK